MIAKCIFSLADSLYDTFIDLVYLFFIIFFLSLIPSVLIICNCMWENSLIFRWTITWSGLMICEPSGCEVELFVYHVMQNAERPEDVCCGWDLCVWLHLPQAAGSWGGGRYHQMPASETLHCAGPARPQPLAGTQLPFTSFGPLTTSFWNSSCFGTM